MGQLQRQVPTELHLAGNCQQPRQALLRGLTGGLGPIQPGHHHLQPLLGHLGLQYSCQPWKGRWVLGKRPQLDQSSPSPWYLLGARAQGNQNPCGPTLPRPTTGHCSLDKQTDGVGSQA